jgi:hypothetical protein
MLEDTLAKMSRDPGEDYPQACHMDVSQDAEKQLSREPPCEQQGQDHGEIEDFAVKQARAMRAESADDEA